MQFILITYFIVYLFSLHDNMTNYLTDLQTSYYTLLCLWLITFDEKSFEHFKNPGV